MEKFSILVVDDEAAIREMIRMTLVREEYEVIEAETAEEAKAQLNKEIVHLVLLDWMLPSMSGIDFAKSLRTETAYQYLPIIMLTAKTEEHDKLSGFEAGIDDYITKPFSLKEMLARVQSVLRRSYPSGLDTDTISLSGLTLSQSKHKVYTKANEDIHLGPTEFRLLHFLMSRPDRVFSRDQLLDFVWGENIYVDERTVDVHIRRLRKALSPHHLDSVIRTVRGSGYSFVNQAAE
ncbi:phosphate regulon transcriptional regulator PhoB [Ostreibacterium oceani]|uniref:Phosphate regulon transcriptional regulatory protein PhoB n=1 Tax=Ostreibacterium oceani TaxID=2654998 RepID=A0A6N7ERA8_9GAMM|nr:phosphate regulon transcriptional regulator PhoB [Ostreibacterium oceani]MPV85404.1 phosphate regulon transcriptional regulatory protein PhoB [Ostreibacterium oceani]